jgi:putative transcriptional regulator
MKTKHDWRRADARTDAQIHAAALADPDAQPLTPERLAGMRQTPRLKIIRRALGLTQEEFAARYQIPLGTLRDWEQGAKEPDQAARAYLKAIAGDPAAVHRALQAAPAPPRPMKAAQPTRLEDVGGRLHAKRPARTSEKMQTAIGGEVRARRNRGRY